MATKELKYRVGMDIGDLRRKAAEAGTSTAAFRKELKELETQQRAHRQAMTSLGTAMTGFGVATVAGLGMAVNAAIQWETAFTGVRKTVDGTAPQLAELESGLRGLARTLPATHESIAAVAEAAGQLGIKRQDIVGFTKVMIDLGNTTNLSAEDAATALAKFSNIMGTSASDVDRLGASLVALGNDGASTEQDIIDMGLRIAGAGHLIGLTEAQVLGISSALSSVGIEAELGGTAISTTMIKIQTAVQTGSAELGTFAKIAGTTATDFAARWRADPAAALTDFIQGLARMQRSGENITTSLDDMGLAGSRIRDTLLRASGAADLFSHAIQVGTSAWAENTALTNEANQRYATTASKLQLGANQVKDAMIDVGAAVVPMVAGVTGGISDVVKGFQTLPGPLKDIVTWAGSAAGIIALVGGAGLIAAPKLARFRESMTQMVDTGGVMSRGLGKFGLFMAGPWGAAIGAGVGLLGLLAGAAGGAAKHQEELAAAGKSVAQALREQNGVVNQTVIQTAAKAAEDMHMLSTAKSLGIGLGTVTDAILGQGNAYNDLRTRLQEIIKANTEVTTAGKGSSGRTYNDQAIAAQELLRNLDQLVGGKNADLTATRNVDEATKNATGSQKDMAAAVTESADKLKAENDALDALVKAFDDVANAALGVRGAERNYIQQVEDTAAVLKKNGPGLDEHTKKGRENAQALDDQADKAKTFADAASKAASAHGDMAAGAEALKASLESSKPALVKQAEAFGMEHDAAVAYANAILEIPAVPPLLFNMPNSQETLGELERVSAAVTGIPPKKEVNVGVLSEAAFAKLTELGYKVTRLPDGTVTVTGNTQPAQNALNDFIRSSSNRVIHVGVVADVRSFAPGRGGVYREGLAEGGILPFAQGGILSYAAGGFNRGEPAIGRGDRPVMWNEKQTSGETYLPWSLSKRNASLYYMQKTANAWGYDVQPRGYMTGGGGTGSGAGGDVNVNVAAQVVASGQSGRLGRLLLDALVDEVRVSYGGDLGRAFKTGR